MGKFDKYKIDLKGMQSDSVKYEFVLDNLYFTHIDGPEVQKGKVNVELTVKRTSRAFELSFQTDGMVYAPGKCNKAVTSKLSKHLRTNADDDSEDSYESAGGEDVVVEEETEEQIDPRWNELKKILDNN